MATISQARPKYSAPSHPSAPLSAPSHKIKFRHPGYSDEANVLLQFSPCDKCNGEYGIHYDTAQVACSIVAANRWDGFFSTQKDGSHPITSRWLGGNDYYFHVPGGEDGKTNCDTASTYLSADDQYAIVPTFDSWQFPHGNLPPSWPKQQLPESDDTASSNRCCMTQSSLFVQDVHIIQWRDKQWWDLNTMSQYVRQEESIDSPANLLRLKVDVHQLFDRKGQLAIVPKYGEMVAHVFEAAGAAEVIELYHNVPFQDLGDVKVEFLLARMAWTVFPHLAMFLAARRPRKVVCVGNDFQWRAQVLSGAICSDRYGKLSRSQSPKKRKTQDASGKDGQQDEDNQQDNTKDVSQWRRGRKRRRSAFTSHTLSFASQTPSGDEMPRSGSELSGSIELGSWQAE